MCSSLLYRTAREAGLKEKLKDIKLYKQVKKLSLSIRNLDGFTILSEKNGPENKLFSTVQPF